MKGQVSMVDTTKLLSPIHSSFAAWVVQYAVRHCRGEELGPFCWPMLAAGFAVFVHLINLLSILLRCNGFSGIQKAIVDQMGSRPPVTMTFFWCKFGFGKCFGAASCPTTELVVTGYHIQSTFHCMSQSDREMFCCCCIEYEKMTLQKWWFFWFSDSSWGIHLSSFFIFPLCFKCQTTIEWSTLSSLAASCIVVRGSALMIAFSWWLSTSDGQLLWSSSSRLSSHLQNFLNHHCTVCSLVVLGPKALVMLRVVSAALLPISELE